MFSRNTCRIFFKEKKLNSIDFNLKFKLDQSNALEQHFNVLQEKNGIKIKMRWKNFMIFTLNVKMV